MILEKYSYKRTHLTKLPFTKRTVGNVSYKDQSK